MAATLVSYATENLINLKANLPRIPYYYLREIFSMYPVLHLVYETNSKAVAGPAKWSDRAISRYSYVLL